MSGTLIFVYLDFCNFGVIKLLRRIKIRTKHLKISGGILRFREIPNNVSVNIFIISGVF